LIGIDRLRNVTPRWARIIIRPIKIIRIDICMNTI